MTASSDKQPTPKRTPKPKPETPESDATSLQSIARKLPLLLRAMDRFPALVEEKVEPIRKAVTALEGQNKWIRSVIKWLWRVLIATLISFCFDIGITTWLYFSNQTVHDAAKKANAAAAQAHALAVQLQQSQQSRYDACVQFNRGNAAQIQLWTFVLNAPTNAPDTPQHEQVVAQFKALLDKDFAPVPCTPPPASVPSSPVKKGR